VGIVGYDIFRRTVMEAYGPQDGEAGRYLMRLHDPEAYVPPPGVDNFWQVEHPATL
jgi:hypothetical protein